MRVGIDFGEFCAEQKNLSRIIDPQQKDDQPAGGSKAGSNCTAPDVPANERLSDAEERRRRRLRRACVSTGSEAPKQTMAGKQERVIRWLSASQAAEKVDEPMSRRIIGRLARKI